MTKPLPCPFCGHQPRVKYGKVACVNRDCKVKPATTAWYSKGYDHKAIEDWNKRHET